MLRVAVLGRRIAAHPRAAIQHALGSWRTVALTRTFTKDNKPPERPVASFAFGKRKKGAAEDEPILNVDRINDKAWQLIARFQEVNDVFDDPIYLRYQKEVAMLQLEDPKFLQFKNGLKDAFAAVEPFVRGSLHILFNKMFEKAPLATCILIYAFLMKLVKNKGSISQNPAAYVEIQKNAAAFFNRELLSQLHKNDKLFLLICEPEQVLNILINGVPDTEPLEKCWFEIKAFLQSCEVMPPQLKVLLTLRILEILPNVPAKLAENIKQYLISKTTVTILTSPDPSKHLDPVTLAGLVEIWLLVYEQAAEEHKGVIPDKSLFRFRPLFLDLKGNPRTMLDEYKKENSTLNTSKPDSLLEHFFELAVRRGQKSPETSPLEKEAVLCLLSSVAVVRENVLDPVGSRPFFEQRLKAIGEIGKDDALPLYRLLAVLEAKARHELDSETVMIAEDVFESFKPQLQIIFEMRDYQVPRSGHQIRRDQIVQLLLNAISPNPGLSRSFVADKINRSNFQLLAITQKIADEITYLSANKPDLDTDLPQLMIYLPKKTSEDFDILLKSHFMILRNLVAASPTERTELAWLKRSLTRLCAYLNFQLEMQAVLTLDSDTLEKIFKKSSSHNIIRRKICLALKKLASQIEESTHLKKMIRFLDPPEHLILLNLLDGKRHLPRLTSYLEDNKWLMPEQSCLTKEAKVFQQELCTELSKHLRLRAIQPETQKYGVLDPETVAIDGRFALITSTNLRNLPRDDYSKGWSYLDRFSSTGDIYRSSWWTSLSKSERLSISWLFSRKYSVILVNPLECDSVKTTAKQMVQMIHPESTLAPPETTQQPKSTKPIKAADTKSQKPQLEEEEIKEAARGLLGFSAEALGI